jgi:hypothetical protein
MVTAGRGKAGRGRSSDRLDIVLLMMPPWGTSMPPLGLATLVGQVRAAGLRVGAEDLNARLYAEAPELRDYWLFSETNARDPFEIGRAIMDGAGEFMRAACERLLEQDPRAVGFSVNSVNVVPSLAMAGMIKERAPETVIILGGHGLIEDRVREAVAASPVDVVVEGEGDLVLPELVAALRGGGWRRWWARLRRRRFLPVGGLKRARSVERVDGRLLVAAVSPRDLDALADPAFDLLDLGLYGRGESQPAMPMLLSRGCISKCTFCSDHVLQPRFRWRSAERVVAEMERLHREYGRTRFSFNDLEINGNVAQLRRICELLIEKKLPVTWSGYAISHAAITQELLELMRRAGCTSICYGIESGSPAVLKAMGKIFSVEHAERALRLTTRAGLHCALNIIVGFPGEGEREFRETLEFVRRMAPYYDEITSVSSCSINDGAPLLCRREEFGLEFPDPVDRAFFTAGPENTYETRTERVVRLVETLAELGVFPPIINHPLRGKYTEELPRRWFELRAVARRALTAAEGALELRVTRKGRAALYWDGEQLTDSNAFHLDIELDEGSFYSLHADSRVRRTGPRSFEIRGAWPHPGGSFVWEVSVEAGDRFRWRVIYEPAESREILHWRAGVNLLRGYREIANERGRFELLPPDDAETMEYTMQGEGFALRPEDTRPGLSFLFRGPRRPSYPRLVYQVRPCARQIVEVMHPADYRPGHQGSWVLLDLEMRLVRAEESQALSAETE